MHKYSKHINFWLIILLLSSALLHAITSYPVRGPFIPADEGGYLMNAAALAGYQSDAASSYHLGYSVFILPGFIIFENPLHIHRFVQFINIILNLISILVIYKICIKLFPQRKLSEILLATAISSFYPAWYVYSSCALSENAFVLIFILSVYFCIMTSTKGGLYWIFWALALGYLFFIHPKAAPVILAGGLAAILVAWQRKNWVLYAVFLIAVSFMVLYYHYGVQPWIVDRLTISSSIPTLHYAEASHLINAFMSWSRLFDFLGKTSGHIMYLLLGSLGLAGLGIIFLLTSLYDNIKNRNFTENTSTYLYVILSLFGTLLLSSALSPSRFDHWIYGRYMEGVLFPVLTFGFLFFDLKKYYLVFLIAFISSIILGFIHYVNYSQMFYSFISSFWIAVFLREYHPFYWVLFSLPLFIIISLFKDIPLRFIALLSLFLLALFFVQILSIIPSSSMWHDRTVLPNTIRSYSDIIKEPIFIERPDMKEMPRIQHAYKSMFVYHLYNFPVIQTEIETWKENCHGILVSFRDDLDMFVDDLYIFESETESGPYLWLKRSNFEKLMYFKE